jgi:two-component sensor histidine kinase
MRTLLTLLFITVFCTCGRAQPTEQQIRYTIGVTPHDSVKIRAYKSLLLQQMDEPKRVQELLDTIVMYRDIVGTDFARAIWYGARVEIAFAAEDVEEARKIYRESVEDFKQRENNLRVADQSYMLSITYRKEADYASIFAITLDGLKYALQTNRYDMIGKMYNSMGIAQRRMGDPEASIRYFRLGEATTRKLNDDRRLFSPVINLASLYGDGEKLDSALFYYREAEQIARRQTPPNKLQLGYIRNNLTRIYLKQGRNTEALTAAREAYALFRDVDDAEQERSGAASNVADALVALGRHQESLPFQYEMRDFAYTQSDNLDYRRDITLQLARSYAKLGRTDSLAAQYEEVITLTDSIVNQQQTQAILDMEGKYQNEVKQVEIDRLALEDELNKAQLGRQRSILLGGVIVLGLLGAFLYFLLAQRRRIISQNYTIKKSLTEKNTLLKEIHHRVKNNLQMVSSLLSLQGDFIKDDAALDAIEMGQQRVRSMAIIHQRLYLRDEVTTAVSTKDYLEQLIGELMGALNVNGLALVLDKQLEDIEVDIDRMIPLGLVANEVITNALKHAFTGREQGRLTVRFQRVGPDVELMIADDGVGSAGSVGQDDSFGNMLIRTFTEQLEGELRINSEEGTEVRLRFPAEAVS